MRDEIVARSPELSEHEATALARVARGRLDRVDRLLDPEAARRREAVLEVARSVYRDPGFEPGDAARRLMGIAAERADGGEGAGAGRERGARPDRPREGAADSACDARRGARGDPALPRGARGVVPRPRRRGCGSRVGGGARRPARRAARGRERRAAARAPRRPPRRSARRGACTRSSSSRPGSRSRRSSSSCTASLRPRRLPRSADVRRLPCGGASDPHRLTGRFAAPGGRGDDNDGNTWAVQQLKVRAEKPLIPVDHRGRFGEGADA